MNFIAILFTISCALIAATNALQCQPVTCMLACPFGFNIDANGCQYCSCRPRPSGASTSQPAVGTSTARPATGASTANPGTSASSRRPMSRLLAIASGPSTAAPKSSTPAATTARGSTGSTRVTRPATSTQRWLSLVDPKTIYD